VVTDAGGCSITLTQAVNDASGPTAGATTDANVICNGGLDGVVSVTATGGSLPYTICWVGGGTGGTDASISGLAAGNYSVTVTDITGCAATASTSISEPATVVASITATTNPSCFGFSDGTASVGASGGTGAYSYLWSSGEVTNPANALTNGAIAVTVTDAVGCSITDNDVLVEPSVLVVNLVPSDVSCFGISDGAINATIAGGTTGYSYAWSNASNSEDLTGVPANGYTLIVTDANSCTVSANDVINQPALLIASIASSTNVSCNGLADGNATISASGGTSPFNYLWTPSGQTNPTANSLVAGSYSVRFLMPTAVLF